MTRCASHMALQSQAQVLAKQKKAFDALQITATILCIMDAARFWRRPSNSQAVVPVGRLPPLSFAFVFDFAVAFVFYCCFALARCDAPCT